MSTTMDRADRLAALLAERELDALLVTNLVNVRWLTGFTGSNGLALVGPGDHRLFLTDFRYLTQSAEQLDAGWRREIAPEILPAVAKLASHAPGEGTSCGWASTTRRCRSRTTPRWRAAWPRASSSSPPAVPSSSCVRSRTPASWTRSGLRPSSPTPR